MKHFVHRYSLSLFLFLAIVHTGWSHAMQHSVMSLDLQSQKISAQLQLPLEELGQAMNEDLLSDLSQLVQHKGLDIEAYLKAHLSVTSPDGKPWTVSVEHLEVSSSDSTATGYHELIAQLYLIPAPGASLRHLVLHYDVILNRLFQHKVLVIVRRDWANGQTGEHPYQVGVVQLNPQTDEVPLLELRFDAGSNWQGFQSMVKLGIRHIAEGTDHLLFLLVLLLPAPLLVQERRWGVSGGRRYSLIRLLKIITAFTLGHSITLLAGTLGWLMLPSQPVEVIIAISILVTAIHAIRPLFPGNEVYIAGGFGLIHGLAFAGILAELQLEGSALALSILGFNLGIELMQVFVVLVTMPWLLILSDTAFYKWLRLTGAGFALLASLAWVYERCTGRSTLMAEYIEKIAGQSRWIVLALAIAAVFVLLKKRMRTSV